MPSEKNAPALADVATAKEADEASRDSPKRHGDKLGAATDATATLGEAEDRPRAGDSPKRQGDPLKSTIGKDPRG